jgi:hypothetical protein
MGPHFEAQEERADDCVGKPHHAARRDVALKSQALHVCPQPADVAALELQQILAAGARQIPCTHHTKH